MSNLRKRMLCESCQEETEFDLSDIFEGERPEGAPLEDYTCSVCGWMQTSPEGGHCEVLCSWLLVESDGETLGIDSRILAKYIHRTCSGKYGEHYAGIFAENLLALLKSRFKVIY